jgi:NAD(P)-dependent dehydrogenase (short-subunit alcohol dehydrogenase family)
MSSLKHKRVLVVGGSSGIGLGVAAQAHGEGAIVTIASRSQEKLDQAATGIGPGVATAMLDTADNDSVERFFSGAEPWDHVVISAAQTQSGPIRKLSLQGARNSMESKFWGAYQIARAARFSERATLTFISGVLATRPSAASVLQGAINAALEGLSRGLALELSPVRVNCVSPGLIDTPLWSRLEADAREQMYARAAANLPAKTVGQPGDIANAVLFLMKTPFATGSTVRVDGGGAIG